MPLKHGYSRSSIGHNIAQSRKEGKGREQSVAIALDVAHEAAIKAGKPHKSPKAKGKAKGKGK